jgi:hypothetical protein
MSGELAGHMQGGAFPAVPSMRQRERSRPPLSVRSATKFQLHTWLSLSARVGMVPVELSRRRGLQPSSPSVRTPPDALHQLIARLPAVGPQKLHQLAVAQALLFARKSLDLFVQSQELFGGPGLPAASSRSLQSQITGTPCAASKAS